MLVFLLIKVMDGYNKNIKKIENQSDNVEWLLKINKNNEYYMN